MVLLLDYLTGAFLSRRALFCRRESGGELCCVVFGFALAINEGGEKVSNGVQADN
jgi:hypothetical protein